MIKCLQEIVDDGDGVFVKRKKAPKTVPPPAALRLFDAESEDEQPIAKKRKKALKTVPPPAALRLFDAKSEDEQPIAKANSNLGLRILDTDSEGEDNAIEAIKIRVCCYRSQLSRHDIY